MEIFVFKYRFIQILMHRSRSGQRRRDDFWDAFEAPAARIGPSLTSLPSLFSSTESPPRAYELANSCKSTDETEMRERKGNGDEVGGPPSQAVRKELHGIDLQIETLGNSQTVCQTSFLPLASVGWRHTGAEEPAATNPRWFGNLRRLVNRIWAPRGMREREEQTDYAISGQQEASEDSEEANEEEVVVLEEQEEEEEEEDRERRRLRYRRCMHCVYGTEEDEAACCYRLKNVSNTCLVAVGFASLILLAAVGITIMFTVKPPPPSASSNMPLSPDASVHFVCLCSQLSIAYLSQETNGLSRRLRQALQMP